MHLAAVFHRSLGGVPDKLCPRFAERRTMQINYADALEGQWTVGRGEGERVT